MFPNYSSLFTIKCNNEEEASARIQKKYSMFSFSNLNESSSFKKGKLKKKEN